MSWRNNAQRSGMNAQPLGAPRRWGGASGSERPAPPPSSEPERRGPEVSRGAAPYTINGVPSFVSVGAPGGAPGSAPVPGSHAPAEAGAKRPRDDGTAAEGAFLPSLPMSFVCR